jgi:hypothetical protein
MAKPPTGITLAVSTPERRVPGLSTDSAAIVALFFMHAPVVRRWIAEQAAEAGPDARVVVAEDTWRNPGDGTPTLDVPLDEADARIIADRRQLAAEVTTGIGNAINVLNQPYRRGKSKP